MSAKKLFLQVEKDLIAHRDLEYKKGSMNFFKEPINPIGVRAGAVRRIATKRYKEIEDVSKQELFRLCEELLKSGIMEYGTIAFAWAKNRSLEYEKSDFATFERWLEKYIKNWAHCDDFCTHSFGALLYQYPKLLSKVKTWSKSKNRWLRRASSVILIYWIKQKDKKALKHAFFVADRLLLDEDDLVQKGYGWTLKEAANFWQKDVFKYVMKNKHNMPRTALRYAIEKMPKSLKKKAMMR